MDEFRRGSAGQHPILFITVFVSLLLIVIIAIVCAHYVNKKREASYSNPIVVSSQTHEPIGNQQTTHQVPIQINRNDTVDVNSKTDSQMPSFHQNFPMPMPMPMPQMNFQNLEHTNYQNVSQTTVPTAPYPTTSYISPYPVNQPSVTVSHNVESRKF
ncbi:CLUMA_CG005347, isoform A [Clunio marinus]|uniref:CLUMA_CG005347, isoform A n=1 Tax=Clunio marinus TaxID=568069 RepID=A0A1J1HWG3_9DIPT|nr:CLUMA_CG005347, isoform A [Clunio marinus]